MKYADNGRHVYYWQALESSAKGRALGQPVEVTSRETLDPNVRRFETNRWLTGMGGHLYFDAELAPPGAPAPVEGSYEAAVLALGGVTTVYIYGSDITVTKSDESSWSILDPQVVKTLANAFRYYEKAS